PSAVVINEIFYNAPLGMDRLQWIELHNPAEQPANVGGWTIDKGKVLTIPADTSIPAKGFLVFPLDAEEFTKSYGEHAHPLGCLRRALKRGGERLELRDSRGMLIDVVRYKDEAPWPVSPDGYSASLERICPTSPGDGAETWAGSPLPVTAQPVGTPGKTNASFSITLPPVVASVIAPTSVSVGVPMPVSARVIGTCAPGGVVLLYRKVTVQDVDEEIPVTMEKTRDGNWTASIPAQSADTLLRYRVRATDQSGAQRFYPAEHELRPTLSTYVHDRFEPALISQALLILGGLDRVLAEEQRAGEAPLRPQDRQGFEVPPPTRGASAFIHVDQKTGMVEVFDYINAVPRSHRPGSGFILHFQKDHPFREQTATSLLFEQNERWLMAEALSYDLYRRAGNAAPLTEFVRLSVDGKMLGCHLLVERPNKSFLRRNEMDASGNLYKVSWRGRGPVGTHKKKTNTHTGYDDLQAILKLLENAGDKSDEQWKTIQKYFDVDQMATHFAVTVIVSHWDGYSNNYFAYHDIQRGKWQLFPWDNDLTWGEGAKGGELLIDVPLTFGMEGDIPPRASKLEEGFGRQKAPGGRGVELRWWGPGRAFSKPLLPNPQFRQVYLRKVRKILDEVFTEDVYFKIIDDLAAHLDEDVALRAQVRGRDPEVARRQFAQSVELLKLYVTKRREFLLGQDELKR